MKKRYILLIILTIFTMTCISCKTNNKYINEIITKKIDYEQSITIYDLEDALVLASEKAEASIVGVKSGTTLFQSFGSGVIIKCESLNNTFQYTVITNHHVIENRGVVSSKVDIYLGKFKEEIKADVIEYDKTLDLAFVKFSSPRQLAVASTADSTTLKKGRFVIAVGNPYELETFYDTVTIGNISSPNRLCDNGDGNLNYYIQHTAPINSGNSGGGLFDIYGRLIGINNWKYAETDIEGMGFAIPIHVAMLKYEKHFK